ncbi:MAG TPA: LamG domain-containing protein [Kofleriaceae bacterium]
MRVGVASVLVFAACGRVGFQDEVPIDAAADADQSRLFESCMLRMAMDEPGWTGLDNEVRDSCGGHHGRALNGATTVVDGQRGTVGMFGGGTACVQVANATALQPTTALTMSAWVYPVAEAPGSFGVVSRRSDFGVDTAYSFFIWTNDNGAGTTNQLYVDLDTENDRVQDPTTSLLNQWRHLTVVYDGTQPAPSRVVFYVDGVQSFTAMETSRTITPPTGTPPLSIGCLPLTGPAQGFIGRLDEVVLWSRALAADEVAMWHDASRQ